MSDAHADHSDAPHEGPIKTPKQLIVAVVLAFVVPIAAIVLLVSYVAAEHKPGAGSDLHAAQEVAQRIAPVGHVEVKDVSDPSAQKSGEQVFAAVCVSCHGAGVLGAPKFGDEQAWGPRIKSGFDALLNSALHGKGAMPPQGGGDFSDLEVARAVVYMADKGGAKFEEPKAAPTQAAATGKKEEAQGAAATAQAAQAAQAMQAVAAATASAPAGGEAAAGGAAPALYTQVCQACHAAGVAGAPKFGDKAAWAPRIGQGIDALTTNAIHGKGAMPPKGGSNASDAEIKEVVTYMVNAAK
jgi:cytochrome c5